MDYVGPGFRVYGLKFWFAFVLLLFFEIKACGMIGASKTTFERRGLWRA